MEGSVRRGEDQIGEVIISGPEGTKRFPTYTCGHCTQVVVMRMDRTRERLRCKTCGKLLCESNELCRKSCTPMHALAKDHFEASEKWTSLVPAIMGGATSEEEAVKRGLIQV
jgi:ribosomal protein S27E